MAGWNDRKRRIAFKASLKKHVTGCWLWSGRSGSNGYGTGITIWDWRKSDNTATTCSVLEEIADVRILLDQLELIFGETSEYRREKLARLSKRISG